MLIPTEGDTGVEGRGENNGDIGLIVIPKVKGAEPKNTCVNVSVSAEFQATTTSALKPFTLHARHTAVSITYHFLPEKKKDKFPS